MQGGHTRYDGTARRSGTLAGVLACGLAALAGCGNPPPNVVYYVTASQEIQHVTQLQITLEHLAAGAADDATALATDHFTVPHTASDFTLSPTAQKSFAVEFNRGVQGRLRTTIDAVVGGKVVAEGHDLRNLDFSGLDVTIQLTAGPSPADQGLTLVPAGDFEMGCQVTGCSADEGPGRKVALPAYSIEVTEVTQGAYQACVTAGKCTVPVQDFAPAASPDLPVVQVTWLQASQYCAFLGRRLPTEAEWEKAARGTTKRTYPWGEDAPTCDLANFKPCGNMLAVVGPDKRKAGASPSGAVDMAGSVWEWVADWYSATAYSTLPSVNPQGPATGAQRVLRGGGFGDDPTNLRVTNRDSEDPNVHYSDVGFRCARSE